MVFVLLTNYRWFYFRLLWLILFGFAIGYGYLLYTPFLDTWYNEPTVLATDQADFPVEKLPFPAITICSNNKIVYRQLESVLRTQPWKGLNKSIQNFEQDFTMALTALVTAQDDPQRLKELNEGTKSILNNYQEELPNVLRQVKWNFSYIYAQIIYMVRYTCYRSCKPVVMWLMMELECFLNAIGMGNSMNAQIFSSLDQQIVDFAVHLIHWQWKSSCKNFKNNLLSYLH